MRNRRYARDTNAFSKKFFNHGHSLALHFMIYNLSNPTRHSEGASPRPWPSESSTTNGQSRRFSISDVHHCFFLHRPFLQNRVSSTPTASTRPNRSRVGTCGLFGWAQRPHQLRYILCSYIPEDVVIDISVLMGQHIP